MIVSTLATLVAAAPTSTEVEKRTAFDLAQFNNLNGFNQVNLNYLFNINSLDLQFLGTLGLQNNLNILQFQNLFQQQVFDVNALLQLQELNTILTIGRAGLFNGFDLGGLNLGGLNLGLINNLAGVDLQQFIQPNVLTQVQTVASQVFIKE
jgi:hypothetical protein